jgi:hypothetical protein
MRAGQATKSSETNRPMAHSGDISHDQKLLHGESVRDGVRLRARTTGGEAARAGRRV